MKKALSIVVAFIMILTLLPTFAEEEKSEFNNLTNLPVAMEVTNAGSPDITPEQQALYDDYFSTEKEFIIPTDFPDETTYISVDKLSGNLCRMKNGTYEVATITNLYIGTPGGYKYSETSGYVYAIVNDYTIIRCDRADFSDVQIILTSTESLDNIYCDDNLMYYRKGNTLYRLHLASGMQEAVLTFADEYEGYRPLSNLKIRYHKCTAGYQQFLDDGGLPNDYPMDTVKTFPYIYTLATGEAVFDQAYLDSVHNAGTVLGGYVPPENQISTFALDDQIATLSVNSINGKAIPKPGYEDGKYFNQTANNATPCVYHANGDVSSTCLYYKGATQCAGFAHYIYDYIFDVPEATAAVYSPIDNYTSTSKMDTLLTNLTPGSIIRSDNKGHSMIFVSYGIDENGEKKVETYEANVDYHCKIEFKSYTLTNFANTYGEEIKTRTPACMHANTYDVHENGAHIVKCSNCNATISTTANCMVQNHNTNGHYSVCNFSECDYVSGITPHILNYIISGENHYKKCIGCNYSTQSTTHTAAWGSDYNNHWQTCECGYSIVPLAVHTLSGYTGNASGHSRSCSTCGYVQTGSHNTQAYWTTNASAHYKPCTLCGYNTSYGGHSMSGNVNYSSAQHRRSCSVCGYSTYANHSFAYSTWINVSTNATCRRRTKYCTGCSFSTTEYDSHYFINGKCSKCGFRRY